EGEAADLVVGDVGEPHLIERGGDVVVLCYTCVPTAQPGQRGEVLPSGERGVEPGSVDETGYALRRGQRPSDRRAQNLEPAFVGDGQTQQQAKQRRLARAVRPDKPVNLTRWHIQ